MDVVEFGLLDWPVPLGLLMSEEFAPRPVTVMRSTTRRFPANDCAMRFAVCFSFPVETLPVISTDVSVTTAFTFWFARVGSFFSAASICFCRLLDSALALAPVSPCGKPELCGRLEVLPSVGVVPPAAVLPLAEVEPLVPTPVEGALAPVEEEVLP